MKKQREATPIKTLRDAYKVRGFRVLAKLDGYDLEPPVLAHTLNRRTKNRVRRPQNAWSSRNYEAFLQAFQNGEVKRLVVVAQLD